MDREEFFRRTGTRAIGKLRHNLDDPEQKAHAIEHYERKRGKLAEALEYYDFEERRQAGTIQRLDHERYLRDAIGFVFVDEDQKMTGRD